MCCCCPSAVSALFCLWVQSGFSKGSVASALTFFPPDPAFYHFQRKDANGNILPDDDSDDEDEANNDDGLELREETDEDQLISPTDGVPSSVGKTGKTKKPKRSPKKKEKKSATKEKSPAEQLTDRAKQLRLRGKRRNARDAQDALDGVTYQLLLDPRISVPPRNGGTVEALKLPSVMHKTKKRIQSHVATLIYRVPTSHVTSKTKTIIISHGNATDIGAMHFLQAILVHSLDANVVCYDYSGYGESSGVPLENATYSDVTTVYQHTLKHVVANEDASKIIMYGQSIGSGPSTYLCAIEPDIGGLILHSPVMSGMRVLTPSRALGCLDIYPNINRIKKVQCPVFVIHGRLDEEVSVNHGMSMHNAVPSHQQREPWWVPDRGHNDITEGPGKMAEYIRRMRRFVTSLDE